MKFTVNELPVEVADDHPHLLSALREELGITSPKDGCSPQGQCGCCTILLDDKPIQACLVSLEKAEGRTVRTLEHFPEDERARYAAAFAATGALQCGFCTPGIIVRAKALIDQKGPSLDRKTLEGRLGAHLCRCTGYTKIIEAIELLASGEPIPKPSITGGVGGRGAKYEGEAMALGDRGYVDDLAVEGMLHGALRLADHARADVVRIDTSAALEHPGVVAVFTAADVPGDLRVGIIHNDWPIFIPEGGRTSYLGDVLAIVVADEARTAWAATALIEVEYVVHQPIVDPEAALTTEESAVWGLEGNILSISEYSRGDVAAGFAAATHVVKEYFVTQRVEHAFLEPESTLVVPRIDGGIHVYTGGQGVWDDRDQIVAALALTVGQVSVELVSNGGAFGGKEDLSNQAQTALAAHLLRRPVKCTLTREQSFLMHAKRHPISIYVEAGCDANGVLTALWVRMVGDSGPYASVGMKVLERAAGHASGPYVVPAIDVRATAVRTNNPVCGAFRGFGANQAQFAMEGALDRLAERVGISGWEIRRRNVISPGVIWGPGQRMDEGSGGALACLEAVADVYEAVRAEGKAVGIGLGLKNSGLGNGFREVSKAVIHFRVDGVVEVRHGWTEMGQGVHTVARQVVVEELGIEPDRIRVLIDTSRELGFGQTTGSRGTLMAAGSVQRACHAAIAGGMQPGVDYEGEYVIDWTNKLQDNVPEPILHSTFGYAAQVVIADKATGTIEKVVAAHDVGRAINPLLCEGQIQGAVHMGLGYALTEEFPTDDLGMPINMTLRSLGILRPKDMPEVEVRLIEVPQPNSPFGIKGVGEIGLVPTAGAVAAALHEVDGVWRTRLPMSVASPGGEAGERA